MGGIGGEVFDEGIVNLLSDLTKELRVESPEVDYEQLITLTDISCYLTAHIC